MSCSSQAENGFINTQEGESEESDVSGDSQMDVEGAYSFTEIQLFLNRTKGMRSVKVDEFFSRFKIVP